MMPDDLFKKNMEMWEKFTSNYMDTMFKTVEKTLEQSQTFQDKVQKAVDETVSSQMSMTVETLKLLQRQVESLTAKVDELIQKQTAN